MTTTVGIAKLKNNLSYYLKQVQMGYEILVTDHGEVMATISACKPKNNKSSVEDKIKALVALGWVHYDSSKKKRKFSNHKPIKIAGENTMSRWLIEEGRKD